MKYYESGVYSVYIYNVTSNVILAIDLQKESTKNNI